MAEMTLEQIIKRLATKITKAQAAIKRNEDGIACAMLQEMYEELRSVVEPDAEAEEMLSELFND